MARLVAVKASGEHLFFVACKGWVPCNQLKVGDRIATESGAWVEVEAVEDTGIWSTVYNLRVADYHTYFVGCDEWGFSVWAHNADCVIKVEGGEHVLKNRATGEIYARGTEAEVRAAAQQLPGQGHRLVLTREQGQTILDAGANAMRAEDRRNVVLTLTQLRDSNSAGGAVYVLTGAGGIKGGADLGRIPTQARNAIRQQLQAQLGPTAELRIPIERGPHNIPIAQRVLHDATGNPVASWTHGEAKGIRAGEYYNNPAARQWSTLNPSSTVARVHGGAACFNCQPLQQAYGVINETGFQLYCGRFDRFGLNPHWNWG